MVNQYVLFLLLNGNECICLSFLYTHVYSGRIFLCTLNHTAFLIIHVYYNNKYSWTLCHSISAIDHASLDGAV